MTSLPRENGSPQPDMTIGHLLHASYANLASVDAAVKRGLSKRDRVCWMVRAKLFKGLRSGTMHDLLGPPRGSDGPLRLLRHATTTEASR